MVLTKKMLKWPNRFRTLKYGDDFDGCWGQQSFELSDEDIQSLKDGKVLCNDSGEYAILIRRKETDEKYDSICKDAGQQRLKDLSSLATNQFIAKFMENHKGETNE